MKWDEWIGSLDGRPTMWTKNLVRAFGCRVDLHKMVGPDDPGCFHTHPAHALRLVLRGGYLEEVFGRGLVRWAPGSIGLVRPTLAHRVDRLPRGVSYSLWIRFRKTHKIKLVGSGWAEQRARAAASSEKKEEPNGP